MATKDIYDSCFLIERKKEKPVKMNHHFTSINTQHADSTVRHKKKGKNI